MIGVLLALGSRVEGLRLMKLRLYRISYVKSYSNIAHYVMDLRVWVGMF